MTLRELNDLEYEEVLGWSEYFRRRPLGWREDNRAAVIAMSFGGGKIRPEDLFSSLKTLKEETRDSSSTVSEKFFERFKQKFTERELYDDKGNIRQSIT